MAGISSSGNLKGNAIKELLENIFLFFSNTKTNLILIKNNNKSIT